MHSKNICSIWYCNYVDMPKFLFKWVLFHHHHHHWVHSPKTGLKQPPVSSQLCPMPEELTNPSPQKRQKRTNKNLPKSFKFVRQLFVYLSEFKENKRFEYKYICNDKYLFIWNNSSSIEKVVFPLLYNLQLSKFRCFADFKGIFTSLHLNLDQPKGEN